MTQKTDKEILDYLESFDLVEIFVTDDMMECPMKSLVLGDQTSLSGIKLRYAITQLINTHDQKRT